MAVCTFCKSTLLREGEALRKIGQVADLFDDHSPLQLGLSGKYQGSVFTLVGRLQWQGDEGPWNEWHALFDTGRSGWLSEDNGQYVIGFDATSPNGLPVASAITIGSGVYLDGLEWNVAAKVNAKILSAQGELPKIPQFDAAAWVIELRNPKGEVASWATTAQASRPDNWFIGRAVRLDDLALVGGKEESVRDLKGRAIECPNCGASLTPKLNTTKSLVCHQCKAVVDISKGAGSDLQYFTDNNPATAESANPLIPLGSTGMLQLGTPKQQAWQVVGYMERCEIPDDDHDERIFWREYLLYCRTDGFAFLVDSEEGWSWVRPISGTPRNTGVDRVQWEGATYRRKYTYTAMTTWVLGEFYWPVRKDQRSRNTDYEGLGAYAERRLNQETSEQEIIWSAGITLTADGVRAAFKIPEAASASFKRDAKTTSSLSWFSLPVLFVALFVLALIFSMSRCGRNDCAQVLQNYGPNSLEYQRCHRQGGYYGGGGGSFGGFSTGGGHK
jgi:hypothetical protein